MTLFHEESLQIVLRYHAVMYRKLFYNHRFFLVIDWPTHKHLPAHHNLTTTPENILTLLICAPLDLVALTRRTMLKKANPKGLTFS